MSKSSQNPSKIHKVEKVSTPRTRLDALDFALIAEKIKPGKITGDQLAKKFGVVRETVSIRMNRDDFKDVLHQELETVAKSTRKKVTDAANKGADKLFKLMDSNTEAIVLGAVRTAFEYTIPKKLINENRDKNKDAIRLTPEQAAAAAQWLMDQKKKRRKN